MNFLQDNTVQWVIIIILVLLIIYFLIPKNENFTNKEGFGAPPFEIERIYEDPVIIPDYTNLQNGTIMSGTNFIPQNEVVPAWGEQYGVAQTLDNGDLSDGQGGNYTLSNNICSPSCCSSQYPTPFALPYDNFICNNKDELLPSNYVCNNT